jgi:hypothetical protein
MSVRRGTRVRWALASWLFVLSAVAFLDRTNVSIAGLQISKEYLLGNQRLGGWPVHSWSPTLPFKFRLDGSPRGMARAGC